MRSALPSIGMVLITSIYSIVDGFFVSNYAGKSGFAAINLLWPTIMILGAVGLMVGSGGGAKTGGEKVELCTFSAPFKCEIFPKLRTAFDGMRLRVPFATETREDLHEMQQVISNGNYS